MNSLTFPTNWRKICASFCVHFKPTGNPLGIAFGAEKVTTEFNLYSYFRLLKIHSMTAKINDGSRILYVSHTLIGFTRFFILIFLYFMCVANEEKKNYILSEV